MTTLTASAPQQAAAVLELEEGKPISVPGAANGFFAGMQLAAILRDLGITKQNDHFVRHYSRLEESHVPPAKLEGHLILKDTSDRQVLKDYGEPNLERISDARLLLWHFLQRIAAARKAGKLQKTQRYLAYIKSASSGVFPVTVTLRPESQESIIASGDLYMNGKSNTRRHTILVVQTA